MPRKLFLTALAALAFVAAQLSAQEGIQKGKIKKINPDTGALVIAVGDKEVTVYVTPDTKVVGTDNQELAKRLQSPELKIGANVMFKAGQQGGMDVLIGIKLAVQQDAAKVDTSSLKPLTEMGKTEYQGFKGGLYPDGMNARPKSHEAAGAALAKQIQPRDADGNPAPNGKIVILSVGMSNTAQASEGFLKALSATKDVNPQVVFVNGAVGGMTAKAIQDVDSGSGGKYWAIVDQRLKEANVTRAQVQAIWIKEADAGPTQGFPTYAKTLQAELTRVVQIFPGRFPNAKLVYLSSRTYGGYARSKLNPEPYAFESGFSVRWLIEEQLKGSAALNFDARKGEVRAPWLSWGPYLWANGTTKRADGFSWDEADFAKDGTHHAPAGQQKLGSLLLDFFKTDTTTRQWFNRDGAP